MMTCVAFECHYIRWQLNLLVVHVMYKNVHVINWFSTHSLYCNVKNAIVSSPESYGNKKIYLKTWKIYIP